MKYCKKPVIVEAIKFNEEIWREEISNGYKRSTTYPMVLLGLVRGLFKPVIETLEGDLQVTDGDFIIEGVEGEHYACKPDIFEKTYEVYEEKE